MENIASFDPTSWITDASNWLKALQDLPIGLLILLSCIVLGFALKRWPSFNNQFIPLAVIGWAVVLCVVTSGGAPAGLGLVTWKIRNGLVGMALGFIAWGLHYFFLYRYEDKWPWLRRFLNGEDPTNNPPAPPAERKDS